MQGGMVGFCAGLTPLGRREGAGDFMIGVSSQQPSAHSCYW